MVLGGRSDGVRWEGEGLGGGSVGLGGGVGW